MKMTSVEKRDERRVYSLVDSVVLININALVLPN